MPVTAISFKVRTLVTFGSGEPLAAAVSRNRLKYSMRASIPGGPKFGGADGEPGLPGAAGPVTFGFIYPGLAKGSRWAFA